MNVPRRDAPYLACLNGARILRGEPSRLCQSLASARVWGLLRRPTPLPTGLLTRPGKACLVRSQRCASREIALRGATPATPSHPATTLVSFLITKQQLHF